MSSYVLGFQDIDKTKIMVVGGKGANLGEISKVEGIRVPDGSLAMSFPDSRSSQRLRTFFALSSGGSAPLLKRSPRKDTALPSTKALTPETPFKFVLLDV